MVMQAREASAAKIHLTVTEDPFVLAGRPRYMAEVSSMLCARLAVVATTLVARLPRSPPAKTSR
jgi:hypothetical protein